MNKLSDANTNLVSQLETLKPKVVNQREKRHKTTKMKLASKVKRLQNDERKLRVQLRKAAATLKKCAKLRKPIKRSVGTYTVQLKVTNQGAQCSLHNKEKQYLKERVQDLETENDLLKELQRENLLTTRSTEKGKPYLPSIREVFYSFLSAGVATDKIGPLIKQTVNTLTGKEVTDLPSTSKAAELVIEAGEIFRMQIGEILSSDMSRNATMHRDGTSKEGRHFSGVIIANKEKEYTLGVRQMASSDAKGYFDINYEMISDIEDPDGNKVANKILANVSNTMTDRAIVEEAQDRLWLKRKKRQQMIKEMC